MKLLSTVAAGALVLAGCAPFEHGHYADDVNYINDVGDRPGTPVIVDASYSDSYYDDSYYETAAVPQRPYGFSEPASYTEPVYSAPAPVIHAGYAEPASYVEPANYIEPIHHSRPRFEVEHHAPQTFVERRPYIEPLPYIEPANTFDYDVAETAPQVHVEIHNTIAPAVAALPVAKPIHYASAPIPLVAATSVSVAEERYIGETRYAPPEVINAPPVFMRGPGQFSNRPFPDPGYPQFGAPGFGYPQQPQQQGFGFPPQSGFGFGNPYGAPVAANARPAYPQQGYGSPYANDGCTTTCGGKPVF